MLSDSGARGEKIVEHKFTQRFAMDIRSRVVSFLPEMLDKSVWGEH